MKIIIIGCTHAGTAAVNRIYMQHPDAQVTIYEKNDNVSFLSCGIALYLGNKIRDPQGLFYSNPDILAKLGANVKLEHEVTNVNPQGQTVTVKNLQTGETFDDHYDKLIVTTGSWPIIPPIDGIHNDKVFLCKTWHQAQTIWQKASHAKRITIIGGGYIGIELAEAFATPQHQVTLIDGMPRILSKYLDPDFTNRIEKQFKDHGVTLALDQFVQSFASDDELTITTNKGQQFTSDLAILCVGFRPNTTLFKDKLTMNNDGSIMTNEYMQTSDPNIYAAGDAVGIHYNPTQKEAYIPLATNAVRQGIIAGNNVYGNQMKDMGTQATSGLKLFDTVVVSSGMTLEHAQAEHIPAQAVNLEDNYRPEFMLTTTPVLMRLVYNPENRRILGAQLMSKYDVSQSADTISVMIQNQNTIDDLAMVDMLFQPNFDRPFNYLNLLGQAAVQQAAQLNK